MNVKKQLDIFLQEDLGKGDITSALLKKKINAKIIAKERGIIAGVQFAKEIFTSKRSKCIIRKKDGVSIKKNDIILEISGDATKILSCERTVLNLLSRMSGIATQTNYLKKISNIDIYATRKTAPGLRFFDKRAVEIGGGKKHRMSLDQAIMIKDNHIAVEGSIEGIIKKAKSKYRKIQVEVENKNDAIMVAKLGADIIMLDNFTPRQISLAILALKKQNLLDTIKIEVSGGITEKNIKKYAIHGVDRISIGAITNSVKAIDLSLEVTN